MQRQELSFMKKDIGDKLSYLGFEQKENEFYDQIQKLEDVMML